MEFTYLIPVDEDGDLKIESVTAKSIKMAEAMFITRWTDELEDLPYPADIEDLREGLDQYNIRFGPFTEINEF